MGSGIAQVVSLSGYRATVVEVDEDVLQKGMKHLDTALQKQVEKEKITSQQKDAALENIIDTIFLSDLSECDLIIEAAVEDIEAKKAIFSELDKLCPEHTIFASNTSSLTIMEMAAATNRPDRFVGLHFFNPVPVMKLVEVVRTIATKDDVFRDAFAFARSLGKEAIACKDNSGFVVNLLLIPFLLDAIRALENGVASADAIDKAMQLGCGHPMGPLSLIDYVGLDTTFYIANIMFEEYKNNKYAPPPLLRKMVLAGYFGKKTGMGFYNYSENPPKINNFNNIRLD